MRLTALSAAFAASLWLVPNALAAETQGDTYYRCVADRIDPNVGSAMMNTLLSSAGLAERSEVPTPDIDALLDQCVASLSLPPEKAEPFTDLVVAAIFRDEARSRLNALGFDLGWIDEILAEELVEVPKSNAEFVAENSERILEGVLARIDESDPNGRMIGALLDAYLTGRVRFAIYEQRLIGG